MAERPTAGNPSDGVSTDHVQPEHAWPEEAPSPAPAAVKRSRYARVVRALGDIFLTAGMSRGFTSGREHGDQTAISHVMLFGEGTEQGRDSNRGSGPD